jgi:hypothetical protein
MPAKSNKGRQAPQATDDNGLSDNQQTGTVTLPVDPLVETEAGAHVSPMPAIGDDAPAPAPGGSPGAEPEPAAASLVTIVTDHADHFPGFDPAVHAVKDGRPIPKAGGGWQKKRGGAAQAQAAGRAAAPAAKAPAVPQVNNTEAAKQMLNLFVNVAVITFGEQWAPETTGEKEGMVLAVKNYFDSKGAIPVSPGFALSAAILAYSLPRIKHPATQSKLAGIKSAFAKAGAWIYGFFRRT